MTEPRRESPAPWIVAAIAGAALVALVVVFFTVLLPDRRDQHRTVQTSHGQVVPQPGASGQPLGALTDQETAAMAAAGTEAANLISYSRKDFAADYARALAGATGKLKADVADPQRKAALQQTLTQGKFDLSAKVQHTALVGPTAKGNGYVVLVTVYGYKSTSLDVPIPQNLSITVQNVNGKWLASDFALVGVQ